MIEDCTAPTRVDRAGMFDCGLGGSGHVFLRCVKTLTEGADRSATGQIVEPFRGRARDEISLNLIAEPSNPPW